MSKYDNPNPLQPELFLVDSTERGGSGSPSYRGGGDNDAEVDGDFGAGTDGDIRRGDVAADYVLPVNDGSRYEARGEKRQANLDDMEQGEPLSEDEEAYLQGDAVRYTEILRLTFENIINDVSARTVSNAEVAEGQMRDDESVDDAKRRLGLEGEWAKGYERIGGVLRTIELRFMFLNQSLSKIDEDQESGGLTPYLADSSRLEVLNKSRDWLSTSRRSVGSGVCEAYLRNAIDAQIEKDENAARQQARDAAKRLA